MDPTRPHSMRKARISFEGMLTVAVMPRVKPTVAIADTVSNNTVRSGSFSMAEMMIADPVVRIRYVIKTQDAVLVIFSSIRLPKASIFFLLPKVANTLTHST